jgi:hypothetical protein
MCYIGFLCNVTDELNGAKIWKSITTLVGVFLVVAIPVSTIEIFLCIDPHSMTLRITLLYLKTIMCIFHPVGEGTFHFVCKYFLQMVGSVQKCLVVVFFRNIVDWANTIVLIFPVIYFKTRKSYYCWETTDQLHGSRNASSPKKSIRSRAGSAFMNYSIPHTPYSTTNVSPNTRRLKHRRLQSHGSESSRICYIVSLIADSVRILSCTILIYWDSNYIVKVRGPYRCCSFPTSGYYTLICIHADSVPELKWNYITDKIVFVRYQLLVTLSNRF